MKKVISIVVIFILSLCILTGCQKEKETNDNQTNVENKDKIDELVLENKDVLGTQIVNQITFEVISLKYENDVSILEYNITNNSDEEIVIPDYTVLISDKDGIRYEFDKSHKDKILKPNKTIKVKKEIKKDIMSSTDITFELIDVDL